MVGALWSETHARPIVQPEPPLFLLLLRNLQPFAPPDTFDPLVVHVPARIVEQTCDHPISVAAILICQLDDIVGQPVFVDTSLRSFALCGSMLPKCAAGPALGNAKLLPHTVDAFATTRRA